MKTFIEYYSKGNTSSNKLKAKVKCRDLEYIARRDKKTGITYLKAKQNSCLTYEASFSVRINTKQEMNDLNQQFERFDITVDKKSINDDGSIKYVIIGDKKSLLTFLNLNNLM